MSNPTSTPVGRLDQRFSMPDLPPTPWADVEGVLAGQEMAWLSTVRRDGRPHVTPLVFAYCDGRLFVHSGEGEQKMVNLDDDGRCVLTVGQPDFGGGLDVVVEGRAERRTDRSTLELFARAMADKYGDPWVYQLDDEGLDDGQGIRPIVLEIVPTKVLAFGKGERSGQTTFRIR
jgi:hypothetical protein